MSVDQIQDIEVLRTLVKMQLQESARLKAQLAEALTQLHAKNGPQAEQLALQLDKLQKQHASALKQLFGQKSERSSRPATEGSGRAVQPGHGPKEQQSLPLEEVVHDLAAEEAVCDLCSTALEEWEGQFEESVEVDFIAAGGTARAPAQEVTLPLRWLRQDRCWSEEAVSKGAIQHQLRAGRGHRL